MDERGYCEHYFKLCVYVIYERIVKNRAGNKCGTSDNFHIEILYSGYFSGGKIFMVFVVVR